MNTPLDNSTTSADERAIAMYREIMGVSREAAEHSYMLIEASRVSRTMESMPIDGYRPHWSHAPVFTN